MQASEACDVGSIPAGDTKEIFYKNSPPYVGCFCLMTRYMPAILKKETLFFPKEFIVIFCKEEERFERMSEAHKREVDLAYGMLGCIQGPVAYVTIPLMSGKRLYEILETYQLSSSTELKKKHPEIFKTEVWWHNRALGANFVKEIASKTKLPLINPGKIPQLPDWGEAQFMKVWLDAIEKKVSEHFFMDGWEYSNGAAEEFAKAMERQHGLCEHAPDNNIQVFDQAGAVISLERGLNLLVAASLDLEHRGFDHPMIVAMIHKLTTIAKMVSGRTT